VCQKLRDLCRRENRDVRRLFLELGHQFHSVMVAEQPALLFAELEKRADGRPRVVFAPRRDIQTTDIIADLGGGNRPQRTLKGFLDGFK